MVALALHPGEHIGLGGHRHLAVQRHLAQPAQDLVPGPHLHGRRGGRRGSTEYKQGLSQGIPGGLVHPRRRPRLSANRFGPINHLDASGSVVLPVASMRPSAKTACGGGQLYPSDTELRVPTS